jgi:predicted nucleic acid-binding protein
MSAACFVDTNVLVYFRDAAEPEKQTQAQAWLTELWRRRLGRISHQVLQEYYVTVTQRLSPGLSRDEARTDVRNLITWNPVGVDGLLIESAWSVQDRFMLSWWDALIVAAAQRSDCGFLLTEDLQHEQRLDDLVVVSPFQARPEEILPA